MSSKLYSVQGIFVSFGGKRGVVSTGYLEISKDLLRSRRPGLIPKNIFPQQL